MLVQVAAPERADAGPEAEACRVVRWTGSAFGAELEGLVQGNRLAAELAGDGTVLRVSGNEGIGLALLGALVDVEHREVDHAIDDGADDQRLLPTVAGRPDAALLAIGGGIGTGARGGGGRGNLHLLARCCGGAAFA